MVRKLIALVVVAVVAVTAFFIWNHPPMRLMPPPLAIQMGGERIFEVAPKLEGGSRIEIFYATNRLPVGPSDRRVYTVAPDRSLRLGSATLRIGDEESTLDQIREWTTRNDGGERPFLHLESMREAAVLPDGSAPTAAARDWLARIDTALEASRTRDILVYVHGANTTVERAAGQASQLRHFSGHDAVVVLFTWPTAENFLRYGRDIENAFASGPHLAELIGLLSRNTDADEINVFTYSAGATVGSTGLAVLSTDDPEAAAGVGEIYHAAPDADLRKFVDDLKLYAPSTGRVTTALNLQDSALRLAAVVQRGSRAGRPDLRELDEEASEWILGAARDEGLEVIQILPETMPDLPANSHTFWYDDPWVSNDLMLIFMLGLPAERRGLEEGLSPSGGPYWTFPADYEDRVGTVLRSLAGG